MAPLYGSNIIDAREDNSSKLEKRVTDFQHTASHKTCTIFPIAPDFTDRCTDQHQKFFRYRYIVLFITFCAYTTYHLSRKPISIVKSVLGGDCENDTSVVVCGWEPFNGTHSKDLLGAMDYSYLFPYAIGMFVSGHIAERMDLRYFLTFGMVMSGLCTALFGVGYYLEIHSLWFYLPVQMITGFFETTGWPAIVTCVANWFGKGRRGLIMGIWNCHTSLGNILGAVIAGFWVNSNWGLSFIVPGAIIAVMGILIFLFLVPKPSDIGCMPPDHYTKVQQRINDANGHCVNSAGAIGSDQNDDDDDDLMYGEDDPLVDPSVNNSLSTVTVSSASSSEEVNSERPKPISFVGALKIPGVLEFSFCLFFAKLVSYTFLFWLPDYISNASHLDAHKAADLSTVFDFGGCLGGIVAGVVSDATGSSACTCAVMLLVAAPLMFIYEAVGSSSLGMNIALLFIVGAFVNGPYALITTAVSADLGTHPSLHGNAAALATVTAIIDGTGSIGAAIGPLLTSVITQRYKWNSVFYMLIAADLCALLLLVRLVYKDITKWCQSRTSQRSSTTTTA